MEFWRFVGSNPNYGDWLHGTYDWSLVSISILIACLASYAAFAVVDRISSSDNSSSKKWWLVGGAVAMGFGIWAMHFTAMLAHHLEIQVTYKLWITLVSVVPAMIGSGFALNALSQKNCSWIARAWCGLLLAIAIGTMHYVGMEAMNMNAMLRYDLPLFVLSLVVAYFLAVVALNVRIVLRTRLFILGRYKKSFSALIMGFSVAGMHYTAMAATRIYPLPGHITQEALLPPFMMAWVIFISVSLIIGLTIIGTLVDKRLEDAHKSLRESEAWADKIIDSAADGLISMDDQGIILSFNQSAERIFGYTAKEAVGQNVKFLMTSDDRENHDGYLHRYRETGRVTVLGIFREVTGQHKDGSVVPLELGVTEISREQGVVFIGVLRDITNQKQSENTLKVHARQQAAIAELGQYAVVEYDLDRMFSVACAKVAEVLESDYSKVMEMLPERDKLLLRSGIGWHEGLVGSATVDTDEHGSQAGYTLVCEKPVVVENLATDSRFNGPELLRNHHVKSGVSVLINCKEGVFGILGVHSKKTRTFTPDDVNFIKTVASMLSQVIDKSRMESQRKQSIEILRLIGDITKHVNVSESVSDSLSYTLRRIYEYTGCVFGHVFVYDPERQLLVSEKQHYNSIEIRCDEFLIQTEQLEIAGGKGLIGRVFESRKAAWVSDITTDSNYRRAASAAEAGLHTGLAFPVLCGDRAVAVLEFFSTDVLEADMDLLNAMNEIGVQLGRSFERSEAQAKREQVERELRLSQKLESIGQLAAGVAHEINTPTQFVGDNIRFLQGAFQDMLDVQKAFSGLLEVARKEAVASKEVEQVDAALDDADNDYLVEEIPNAIEQSVDGVSRIAKIVGAMKAFSHMGAESKELTDLNTAITNTITVASNEWKYVSEIELDLDENLPMVPCFPAELNQVVLNLVVNAAHAIKDVIENSASDKGTIKVSSRQLGQDVEIRVSDTGDGIPEGVRSRIFDPFYTTKEVGKGTGQGLSIAYSTVVDKHGGSLSFETQVGEGTTFVITIPLIDSETDDVGAAAVAAK